MIKISQTFRIFLLIVLSIFFVTCGAYNEERQFTKKIETPNIVSELYGSATKTFSISHPDGGHIAWLGFINSNFYQYFKIVKVMVGNKVIVSDGVEVDGNTYVATSNAVIKDIVINATENTGTEFFDGNISVGGSNDLKITITYSPLKANVLDETSGATLPHDAFLNIAYDNPTNGSIIMTVNGMVQGIQEEVCAQSPDSMEVITYKVKNSAFDLYFCSKEVAKTGQNNTPQDSSDPNFHGVSTNIASVPLTNDTITFYKPDNDTICLLTAPDPTFPPFVLPIPEGLSPIDSMDIAMVDGSFAECTLDAENNILCDSNVLVDALVSLNGFTLTNQGFTAEELVTEDCPDFGPISGSGAFGDSEVTLLLTGRTLSDQNTEEYNIVDSLIMATIPLEQ